MAFISVSSFAGLSVQNRAASRNVCAAPARAAKWTMDGKGFGGGEATRDPAPTKIDKDDPKGKQKAIHPAETFAEYSARVAREKAEKEGKGLSKLSKNPKRIELLRFDT